MKEMLKKRWKIIVAVLVIAASVLGLFWGLGYRGLPVARNKDAFIKWMTKTYGATHEITEKSNKSVSFEIAHKKVSGGADLYDTLIRSNIANMNIEFKTGGSFAWPVSHQTLQKEGWEPIGGQYVNSKKQYIQTLGGTKLLNGGMSLSEKIPMLFIYTDKKQSENWLPLDPVNGPKYYKAPKFVACDKITNHSNFSDILELGVPAQIKFQDDDRPTITVTYIVFGDGGTEISGGVSFVIDAAKNRLLEVIYTSA